MIKKIAVFDTPVEWETEPTKADLDLIDKIYMGMAKATMRRICNLYAKSSALEDFSFEQAESMFAKDLYSQNWVILPKVEVFCDEKIFEKSVKNG